MCMFRGKMIEKCKVLGCNNTSMDKINKSGCHETMKDVYGYCQIHRIEGLVEEVEND